MLNKKQIQIGKSRATLKTPVWVNNWSVKNIPERSASIPTAIDGTMHFHNVDEWLRPEIDFDLGFRSDVDYAEAEQIVSLGAFVCKCYNPGINMWFTGLFKLTDSSLGMFLHGHGNKYLGASNYRIKARSVFPYVNFLEMIERAEEDLRF